MENTMMQQMFEMMKDLKADMKDMKADIRETKSELKEFRNDFKEFRKEVLHFQGESLEEFDRLKKVTEVIQEQTESQTTNIEYLAGITGVHEMILNRKKN